MKKRGFRGFFRGFRGKVNFSEISSQIPFRKHKVAHTKVLPFASYPINPFGNSRFYGGPKIQRLITRERQGCHTWGLQSFCREFYGLSIKKIKKKIKRVLLDENRNKTFFRGFSRISAGLADSKKFFLDLPDTNTLRTTKLPEQKYHRLAAKKS